MLVKRIIDAMRKQEWGIALVELFIVVIGIFLALQANDWNEDRKAQSEGYFYLDLLRHQLTDEIRRDEEGIALMREINSQIKQVAASLFAESWTEEEFQQFKDQHVAVYVAFNVLLQSPPALKQLVNMGKIDLIRSRQLQQKLFELDMAYERASNQNQLTDHFVTEAVHVISMGIPYGTSEDLMAIPVSPDVLLKNRELKAAVRVISIMNEFTLDELDLLQDSRREMRDELNAYLSARAFRSNGVEPKL